MKIQVKYFGLLAEETGKMDEIIEFEDHEISTKTLFEYCNSKYTFSDPASIRIAVNQQLDYQNSIVHGDELALLPPFAGG